MPHCSLFLQESPGKSRSPLRLTGMIFEVMVGVALAVKQHFPALLFLPCKERGILLFQSLLFFSFCSSFQKLENLGLSASGWQNAFFHMLLKIFELNLELNFMKSYLPELSSEIKKMWCCPLGIQPEQKHCNLNLKQNLLYIIYIWWDLVGLVSKNIDFKFTCTNKRKTVSNWKLCIIACIIKQPLPALSAQAVKLLFSSNMGELLQLHLMHLKMFFQQSRKPQLR